MKILHTRSDDGTSIRLGRWNEDGDRNILLVHGLAEHLGRYQHIGEFFAEKGWRVTAVELRGHGESGGKRGHTPSWMQYCEDLQAAMGTVGSEMTIVAHSMGGLVTLWSMMHGLTPPIRSVVLSNPLLGLFQPPPGLKILLGKLASKIAPTATLPNDLDPSHICRDPDIVQAYVNDPLVFSGITARWADQMLRAIDAVHNYAPSYHTPLNLLTGGADTICSPNAANDFAKKYGGKIDTVFYPQCYHELFNEPEKFDSLNLVNQ